MKFYMPFIFSVTLACVGYGAGNEAEQQEHGVHYHINRGCCQATFVLGRQSIQLSLLEKPKGLGDYARLNNLLGLQQHLAEINFSVDTDPKRDNVPRLETAGLHAVSAALKKRKSLRSLYLMGNDIDDKGADILGQIVSKMKHLQRLELGHNPLGDQGVAQIVLQLPATLKMLDLEMTGMGTDSVSALIERFPFMALLEDLYVGRNETLVAKDLKQLFNSLERLPNLRILSLEGLSITDDLVLELLACVGKSNIKELHLDHNPISNHTLLHVVFPALEKVTSLKNISFGHQKNEALSEDVMAALKKRYEGVYCCNTYEDDGGYCP